jgi:hypothetical protein
MYTYWWGVNFTASTVRVSRKPDRAWTPKAYKERESPIPTKLAKSLKAWKAKSEKTCSLVFPTAGCNPEAGFSRLPQGCRGARETRLREFLASQVQSDVCDAMPFGGCRSAHRPAMAWAQRHGEHDAIFEAFTQSTDAREGEPDFRIEHLLRASRFLIGYGLDPISSGKPGFELVVRVE